MRCLARIVIAVRAHMLTGRRSSLRRAKHENSVPVLLGTSAAYEIGKDCRRLRMLGSR